jgi:AcrR family transcriptional regulator
MAKRTGSPRRHASGGGERYAEIVHGAGKLFAEHGFDNTSLQDVGDAVGVLKGSLYYYIESKEQLLYDVIKVGHEGLLENIRICRALKGDPLETLSAFAYNHIALNAHPDRYERGIVFLRDSHRLSPEKREMVMRDRDAYDQLLRKTIADGQRQHLICPDLNPTLTSFAVLGVLNSFQRWYRPTGPASPDEIAREFAAFVVAAVACTPADHVPGHRRTMINIVAGQIADIDPIATDRADDTAEGMLAGG